jgi:predicted protein tyrosine phosphatase
MKVLFICGMNRMRSPTAEAVFAKHPGIETSSAGTRLDADNPVSADQIEWADIVVAMEETHRRKLRKMFPGLFKTKKIVVLGIPDEYGYMNSELIDLLHQRSSRFLKD